MVNGKRIGGIDKVEKYILNAKGQTIQTDYDNDANDTTDNIDYIVMNANGNWIEKYVNSDANTETGIEKLINDKNVSGIDKAEIYTVNNQGKTIKTEYDNDGNGKPERIEYLKLDNSGNLLEKYIDIDGDTATGRVKDIDDKSVSGIDKVETYELNAKGQGIKISYDNNADGIVDSIDYAVLNANGAWLIKYTDTDPNALVKTGNDVKISGDLAAYLQMDKLVGINQIVEYGRDSQGRMIRESQDNDADGNIDYIRYVQFYPAGSWKSSHIDEDGNEKTGKEVKLDNGDVVKGIDKQEFIFADSKGDTIARSWDNDMDGTPDSYQKIVPNQNGNWVEVHNDGNNDGAYESSEFYTLDQYGRTSGTTYITYSTPVKVLKPVSEITSADGRLSTKSYIRDVNGEVLITATDANSKDGLIDTLQFANRNYEASIRDLLGANKFALGEIKKSLTEITLSNDKGATTIHLDSATAAQISKANDFAIRGDSTDKVNLSSDFAKLEDTTKQVGTDVLQAYRTEVDGTAYTVYIDTDVNTVMG